MNKKKLREVASHFATGITIITLKTESGEVHGMTANSFLSVSLEPPLVLFSIKNESRIHQLINEGTLVGINILSEEMKEHSQHFAGSPNETLEIVFRYEAEAPILKETLVWYATKVQQIIPAGDHQLVLCEVLALDSSEEFKPILYYKGYRNFN